MTIVFHAYLRSGIWGAVTIVFVLLLRLFLKSAPRRFVCVLWILVVLRLLVPLSVNSRFSIQPALADLSFKHETLGVQTGIDLEESDTTQPDVVPSIQTDPVQTLSAVWLCGAAGAVVYTVASYVGMKRRLKNAISCPDGIHEDKSIRSAFLLGYFHPGIYLPTGLDPDDRKMIVLHEQAHLKRLDNWWKMIGFLCICLHWYNPVVWLGYALFCQDIEVACDERVIGDMDTSARKRYSMALLNCGKKISALSACPVAFGEVNLKQRIKNILCYRKPGVLIRVTAILLAILVALCFLTTSEEQPNNDPVLRGSFTETMDAQCGETTINTQPDALQVTTSPTVVTEPPTMPVTDPETEPVPKPKPKPTVPKEESTDISWDYSKIDSVATQYASQKGFQVLETHPNTSVESFRFSESCYFLAQTGRGEKYLISEAKKLVDKAVAYCKDNGYSVKESVMWVEAFPNTNIVPHEPCIYVYCAAI